MQVVALAVASPEAAESARQAAAAPYPVLADPEGRVARAYGVYNLLGDGLAAPSVFVISADGHILWSHVGQEAGDRPAAVDILARLP